MRADSSHRDHPAAIPQISPGRRCMHRRPQYPTSEATRDATTHQWSQHDTTALNSRIEGVPQIGTASPFT